MRPIYTIDMRLTYAEYTADNGQKLILRLLLYYIIAAFCIVTKISVFGRISGVCQPYVSRMSAVCLPYISRISAVYQSSVSRISLSAVCQPSVSRGTAVCQPYISRMSAVCQPYLISQFAQLNADVAIFDFEVHVKLVINIMELLHAAQNALLVALLILITKVKIFDSVKN